MLVADSLEGLASRKETESLVFVKIPGCLFQLKIFFENKYPETHIKASECATPSSGVAIELAPALSSSF